MLSRQQFDITSLHKAYENGVTAEDVVTEVFRRIDAINDPGIFLHLDEQERILSEARDLGKFDPISHPLWGIPYVVKDNIDVGGMPTTELALNSQIIPRRMLFRSHCYATPARW